ncbi:ABC-2 transporter permease [Microlunatus sp. Y2014]|uniref:ABC-2 transporter permease n=1 Tax=Microlunatus sp. Y2014 TaxID=3418488 RepID=UPI003DA73FBE
MSTATLLYKESRLVLPAGYLLIVPLTLFNLIPHYPMIIGVAYVLPALFIALSEANANRDLEFTVALPVRRDRVVLARHVMVAALQLVQVAALAVVAVLIGAISPGGNIVGMDGNPAFFGFVLAAFGVFNAVFLPGYFASGHRMGKPAVLAGIAFFAVYGVCELVVALVPGVAAVLDTLDPAAAGPQVVVLAVGMVAYMALTVLSYRMSVSRFARVDL